MASVAEKMEAARKLAEQKKVAAAEEQKKKDLQKKDVEKEDCPFCHKKYAKTRISAHIKDCADNPENEGKEEEPRQRLPPAVLKPVIGESEIAEINRKIEETKAENALLKKLIDEIKQPKKRVSASTVYSEMIKFCNDHKDNPVYDMIVKHCTDGKRHWRSIAINIIDTLFEMGTI